MKTLSAPLSAALSSAPALLPEMEVMERAFYASDASFDGLFYAGVRTTGIFCRPSCTARKPLRKNLEFHATVREAVFAGLRPCLRCRPLEAEGAVHPEWVERLLAAAEAALPEKLTDAEVTALGVEPARARRYFQKEFGMTFHAWCRGRRLSGAFSKIRAGATVEDAMAESGYGSHSGFRQAFGDLFGQSPGKTAENGDFIRIAWLESPLGPLVAGATDAGVCLLEFTDRRMLEAQFETLRRKFALPLAPGDHPHLETLRSELAEYFDGKRTDFTVPLVAPGSEFERRVWEALRKIPCGQTRSYEELAHEIGAVNAQRAVGRANGLNRISIVIPCHRVINKNGEMGGYGGGVWRKRRLLEAESIMACAA